MYSYNVDMTGKITKEAAFELLDAFVEAGGNFIDTANLYHFGESEEWNRGGIGTGWSSRPSIQGSMMGNRKT
jgi:predicted aldo/keto reductase-like oxidoreductase